MRCLSSSLINLTLLLPNLINPVLARSHTTKTLDRHLLSGLSGIERLPQQGVPASRNRKRYNYASNRVVDQPSWNVTEVRALRPNKTKQREEKIEEENREETNPVTCNQDTKWTRCSKSCGLGMQVRYVMAGNCYDFERETRLCHDSFCLPDNPFPIVTKRGFSDKTQIKYKGKSRKKTGRSRKRTGVSSKLDSSSGKKNERRKQKNKKTPKSSRSPTAADDESNRKKKHLKSPTEVQLHSRRENLKYCRSKKNNMVRPKRKSKIRYAGCTSRKEYKLNYCTEVCGLGPHQTCCQKNKVKQVRVRFYCKMQDLIKEKQKRMQQQLRLQNSLRNPEEQEAEAQPNALDGYYGNCKATKRGKYCTFSKNMEIIKNCKCSKKTKGRFTGF